MQISAIKTDSMVIKSCGSDSHGVIVCDPSLGRSPMELDRNLDLRWLEKVAGDGNRVDRIKANYQNWAGWTRCYQFPCTVNNWEVYYGVSVISKQGDYGSYKKGFG